MNVKKHAYALAWIRANPVITAPLLGPRTQAQLEDNLGGLDVSIPPHHLAQIDALVPPGTRVGSTLG